MLVALLLLLLLNAERSTRDGAESATEIYLSPLALARPFQRNSQQRERIRFLARLLCLRYLHPAIAFSNSDFSVFTEGNIP